MSGAALMNEQPQLFPRTPILQEPPGLAVDIAPHRQHVRDLNVLRQIRRHPVAAIMNRARALVQPQLRHHDIERGFPETRHRSTQQKLAVAALREFRIEVADLVEDRAMAEARGQQRNVVADILEREPGHVPTHHPPHRHLAIVRQRAEDAGSSRPNLHVGSCGGGRS
jgi:hypothetical protein